MSPQWKERLLRWWERLVCFANWCEKHGIPAMVVKALLDAFLWWLKRK